MRWFVRGDLDGFFGLALDNLVQLLLIDSLCRFVLEFPAELVYQRILPGAAVSLVFGNLFYSWQAKRLAAETGRSDVCALPYGINTVSLLAFVFLVMAPAKAMAELGGASKEEAAYLAWQAGLVACLGSGLVEFFGAFVAQPLRRLTPRAALLATLAGIALGFISMNFFLRSFARPIIGLTTLSIILLTYFGNVRFRGGLPGGFIAIGVGTALAWLTGLAPTSETLPAAPSWHPPLPVFGNLIDAVSQAENWQFLSIMLPMGLFSLIGSVQNLESAEAAGDRYPTTSSLAVNGLGTLAAASFGSCFPTTIYIGHPGWKSLGARAGYSLLNAGFFTLVCCLGLLGAIAWAIPIDAGMAIVLYIGIVMTAQAFQATPTRHAPAVVVGLFASLAAWGTLQAKIALRVAGYGTPERPFTEVKQLIPKFHQQDFWIDGGFALAEGFLLTSMILAAITVAIIERQFRTGAVWCLLAVGLSLTGLMHGYRYTIGDTALDLSDPAWPWAIGYAVMAGLLLLAPWLIEDRPSEVVPRNTASNS